MKRAARGAVIPLLMLSAWECGSRSGALPIDTLSRPSDIGRGSRAGVVDGSILSATWETLEAALAGFALAALAAVLCGVALGLSPRVERIVGPSIDAMRPVPSVALIPLALLLFGFGLRMEASVVAFACFWPVLLITIAAVRGIEPRLLEVARSLELSFSARVRKIILPAAFGRISVGLRIALGIALVGVGDGRDRAQSARARSQPDGGAAGAAPRHHVRAAAVAGCCRLGTELRHSTPPRVMGRHGDRGSAMMRRLTGSGAGAALFAAALLLSWQILAGAGVISQIFFPSPSRTLGELYAQVVDGALWQPLGATALRMTYGWVAASLLGVVLGAVIGSSRAARDFLEPILEFMRPLPASAIIPVAILFLGLSNEMATAVIAFGAIWPVLLASVHGFASIEPQLVEVAQALRLSRWEFLRTVAVPGALPERPRRSESEPRHCADPGRGHGNASLPPGARPEHPARAAFFPQPGAVLGHRRAGRAGVCREPASAAGRAARAGLAHRWRTRHVSICGKPRHLSSGGTNVQA